MAIEVVSINLNVKYLTLPAALSPVLCEEHALRLIDKKLLIKIFEHKKDKTNNQCTYVVGSKSFRPDIQKPRQMENVVRDI